MCPTAPRRPLESRDTASGVFRRGAPAILPPGRMERSLIQARRQASEEGWGPPFSEGEYRLRRERVIERMRAAGIDTLLVTSPANITYLTGYDMIWYYLRTPSAVVVHADTHSTLFYELEYHRPTVAFHAVVDDVYCFESFHVAVESMVRDLSRRGWATHTVGLESWSRNPNGNVLAELRTHLEAGGSRVEDASWLVDGVRLIKTDAEVEAIREAARIADAAMEAVLDEARVGMTEIELAGIALAAMMKEGGGDPAIRVAVRSGPRFLARHCAPSHRRFNAGELVWVNFCGSYHRYHCDLGRTLSLGEPDGRWVGLVEAAAGLSEKVLSSVTLGEPTQAVQERAEMAVQEAGLAPLSVLVGGYDLGIAVPPDWVGHTFTKSERGFEVAAYELGMVSNFEFLFRGGSNWSGGAGGGFIDTVAMRKHGLEVFSKLGREIRVKQA